MRQQFCQMLLDYGYRPQDIGVNYTIRAGSQVKYLDVCVFRDVPDRYQQRHIMLVAEVKKRNISDKAFDNAKLQAESYASQLSNCCFVAIYNGDRFEVYRKGYYRDANGDRGDFQLVGIDAIPPPEQVGLPLPPATLGVDLGERARSKARNAWTNWTAADAAHELAAWAPPPLPPPIAWAPPRSAPSALPSPMGWAVPAKAPPLSDLPPLPGWQLPIPRQPTPQRSPAALAAPLAGLMGGCLVVSIMLTVFIVFVALLYAFK